LETRETRIVLVKKENPKILGKSKSFSPNSYYHILNLHLYKKDEWRTRIQEYQTVVNLLTKDFINLDELEVPEEFIEANKKQKTVVSKSVSSKRLKVKGEIVGKKGVPLLRYTTGKNCKFDSQIYDLEKIEKEKHLKIYTKHEESQKLDKLYATISKQKIEIVTFSDRELKIVNSLNIHNLISYEKFMEGKNAPFKRIITSYLIHKFIRENKSIFDRSDMIGFISKDLENQLIKLEAYRDTNYSGTTYPNSSELDTYNAMLVVAEEHNLFDMNIYPELLQLKELLNKLTFLNPLFDSIDYAGEEEPIITVIADLFKYYKHKVNLKHYNVTLNSEILTEEQVDKLID